MFMQENITMSRGFRRVLPDTLIRQFTLFSLVGVLNTLIDVAVLNALLWYMPTNNLGLLVSYNTFACAVASLNSFCWNKYWTFKRRKTVTLEEIMRFICVALSSLLLNDALMWMLAQTLPVFMARNMLGANILKIGAIGGTMLLSFFGMRLWVFVSRPA